jgi:hypothetical protein
MESTPLHQRLPLGWAVAAYALLCLFMLALVALKNRIVSRWQPRRATTVGKGPGQTSLAVVRTKSTVSRTNRLHHRDRKLLSYCPDVSYGCARPASSQRSGNLCPGEGRQMPGAEYVSKLLLFNKIRANLVALSRSGSPCSREKSG